METILGLVPDGRALAVEDLGGDLLPRMGGQAVQDDRAVIGRRQQVGVDSKGGEVCAATFRLGLVPHADPDVGVDRIGAGDGVAGVVGQLGAVALLELVAGRRRDHDLDPGELTRNRKRTGDVVAVADVGEPQAIEVPEALAQGEQIGERLAGVVQGGQGVDHGDRRLARQLLDLLVGPGADHDRVQIAGQHPGGVGDRLATGELQFVPSQDQRRRAQLGHADLEGDPRPRRGLLEDEGDAATGQLAGAGAVPPAGFQLGGAVEQLAELECAQLFACQEVLLQVADTKCPASTGSPPRGETCRVQFKALSWNLFHGRDFPPDPALLTWRSRLLRIEERNATHVQVNRDLLAEFATVLRRATWDVALLQECPPRYAKPLARACEAEAHRVLTSRNSFAPLRRALTRLNPDLIASGEGGSNLILVRSGSPLGGVVERREVEIHLGRPERRAMGFVRTASDVCVANLHATSNNRPLTAEDLRLAARTATEWAGEGPLLFGGDLNLRPAEDPSVFDELRESYGLDGTTGPRAIDHLLSRGLTTTAPPTQWPPQQRELSSNGLALRLSDHAPVEASFAT